MFKIFIKFYLVLTILINLSVGVSLILGHGVDRTSGYDIELSMLRMRRLKRKLHLFDWLWICCRLASLLSQGNY